MTRQDRLVLRYLRERPSMPTFDQACAELDMCRGQLNRHLARLMEEGHLNRVTRPIPFVLAVHAE